MTYLSKWRQPMAAILITLLAILLAMALIPTSARAGNNEVLMYWALNDRNGLPFLPLTDGGNKYRPESFTVRWNENRFTCTVSATWYLYGQDFKNCVADGGWYIDPVTVIVNAEYAVVNAVIECAANTGRCTLRGTGSRIDGTLTTVGTGPIYELLDNN